jgi:hypothetical protein
MRVDSAVSSLSVRPDKRVFMVYAGLTASGYELASLREEDPMAAVAARAASITWPKDLIASGPVWFCTKNDPGRAHPFGSQPLQFSFKTARNAPPGNCESDNSRSVQAVRHRRKVFYSQFRQFPVYLVEPLQGPAGPVFVAD